MEILRCSNLTKTYGQGAGAITALDHVTLSLEHGSFTAVVGASGSGKSTLLHMLGGVDRPTEGNIYIDDEILQESYGKEVIKDAGRAYEPVVLGDDEYFVMGDNRNNSQDSRDPSVGNISRSAIIGRAWIRIWPLNKIGILKHQ